MNSNSRQKKHILFCNCGGENIEPLMLNAIDFFLKSKKNDFTKLSDLCGLAATKSELLKELLKPETEYLVIGCYRRTMDLLFQKISFKTEFQHLNLYQEKSIEVVVEQITSFCNGETDSFAEIKDDSGWPSWYPVIDYSRCTSCGQCADFCLFGVYEKMEGLVKVVNPKGCKNNCPACARICPSTAIIFPKYKNGGAISGSDEIDELAENQRRLKDVESIMGDDIYAALAQRKAKRQSIIREEVLRKALEERNNALNKQKEL